MDTEIILTSSEIEFSYEVREKKIRIRETERNGWIDQTEWKKNAPQNEHD